MSNPNAIPFRPVRGKDAAIQNMNTQNGYLYMATDTRKTYLGMADGQKILMGQDIGIYYGKKTIAPNTDGKPLDPNVQFTIFEIEGNDNGHTDHLPLINDLILNKDGCFYRVRQVLSAEKVQTERLTLQGTGTGGGGGSGPSSGGSWSFDPSKIGYVFSTNADKMEVGFTANYNGDVKENAIARVMFTPGRDNADEKTAFYTAPGPFEFNMAHTIDLVTKKDLFSTIDATEVTMILRDKYGATYYTTITIKLIELSLSLQDESLIPVLSPNYEFHCNLSGATDSNDIMSKGLVFNFYYPNDLSRSILTITPEPLQIADKGLITTELNLSSLGHGIYVMQVQAIAQIDAYTFIYSNILTHTIGRFVEQTSPLLLTQLAGKAEQYTNIPINYLYVTNDASKQYTLDLKINNISYKQINITANVADSYEFYFEEMGPQTIQFTVLESGVNSTVELDVVKYAGSIPTIDINRGDLKMYLNPRNKTNNDTDRDVWLDSKSQIPAYLTGVNYSSLDGWMIDETTGENYLHLISGAKLEMPTFKPFNSDLVNGEGAKGFTFELDFEINGVTDYSKPIISCISRNIKNQPEVGFELVGDAIRLSNSRLNGFTLNEDGDNLGYLSEQTIVEGRRIKISYVVEAKASKENAFPMGYTYFNGILSNAKFFASGDKFIDDYERPATLKIDSTYAQVKIYGIRFYNTALSESVILNNYTAQLPTLEERQKVYASNNVYADDGSGEIDFDKISSKKYDLKIPYMKLTGGYKCSSADKWTLDTVLDAGLPTAKKDYRMVDVEVVYPDIPDFANYENYSYKNVFENGLGMADNLGKKASNGGAIMYGQGTSSMEYPVKNLRIRWKKDKDFYVVRPDISPVEIICMKADYMESSGSHNTGTANLVDALYAEANMQTPGQAHDWGDEKTIVTCIKGHPCLIFYAETEAGPYKYIGKYNLNLDKATPEPFGFNHDDSNFGYLTDEKGELVLNEKGEKQNSIFCYEFLDNSAHPVCNFRVAHYADVNGNMPTTYEDTWYNTYWHEKDKTNYPGWRMGFESRYPEDVEDPHGADAWYLTASWINSLYNLRVQDEAAGLTPKDVEMEYNYSLASQYDVNKEYFELQDDGSYNPIIIMGSNFVPDKYYTRTITSSRFKMTSLEKFKNEYWKYLDKDFLLTYYLVTEALQMTDSRVKNMMIATWGPEWRYRRYDGTVTKTKPTGTQVDGIPQNNNEYNAHFGYIWYPIFYDMDTMLGLNNWGKMAFTYYDNDDNSAVYNGDEVLWKLVRDSLPKDLVSWFNTLEGAGLRSENILDKLNTKQANVANEAFYNGDARYKYIGPARDGYTDHLNKVEIEKGKGPYLYALQGNRSLHREYFVENRMKLLSGQYGSSLFLGGDRLAFRWSKPDKTSTDPRIVASVEAVEPDGKFNFTGLKVGYAGAQLGENGTLVKTRVEPGVTTELELPVQSAGGTEAFLLGVSNLSDLGDLSSKYMGKFVLSGAVRLKRVTLGNPHRDYYNEGWRGGTDNISISSPYLEYFNLQNSSTYNNQIDFSNNYIIKTILLTGSGVSGITLPENGVLQELRLPTSIRDLRIVNHPTLTAENFSLGSYEYDETLPRKEQKIGAGNGHYVNDFSNISSIYVVNTPIDTYSIVHGSAGLLSTYCLQGIDWTISEVDPDMYCRREPTWTYTDAETGELITLREKLQPGVQYYTRAYRNDMIVYDEYTGDSYPADGTYLYALVSMLDADKNITCLPTLEYLLTLNARASDMAHAKALSGKITIAVEGTKVNELALYDRYKDDYPNLVLTYDTTKVEVEEANTINFYPGTADKEYVENKNNGTLTGLTPVKSTLTAKNAHTLAELVGDLVPFKPQTTGNTFSFTGEWMDWADANKTIYYQDSLPQCTVPEGKEAYKFSIFKPEEDMELVPIFSTYVRKYLITLYDYDGTKLAEEYLDYQAKIGEVMTSGYARYCYRAYTDETKPDYRWAFKGWQIKHDWQTGAKAPTYASLDEQIVNADIGYYAFYKEENVHTTPSMISKRDDFFTFMDITINGVPGVRINIADRYRYLLQGKITLPATDHNGKPVLEIGNFSAKYDANGLVLDRTKFTHIYFENGDASSYYRVGDYAFTTGDGNDSYSNLQVIDLPSTIREIGQDAFKTNIHLKTVKLNDEIVTIASNAFWMCKGITSFGLASGVPAKLVNIGVASYFQSSSNLAFTSLPENVTHISSYAFATPSSSVNVATFGSAEHPIMRMGQSAFDGCGDGSITSMTIYCGAAYIEDQIGIQPNAFSGYKVNISNLTIVAPENVNITNEEIASWKLNMDPNCTIAREVLTTS